MSAAELPLCAKCRAAHATDGALCSDCWVDAAMPDDAPRTTTSGGPALVRESDRRDEIPTPDALADAQITDAVYRLHADRRRFLRWPWQAVQDVAGSVAPGELWIVAARTGNGKSLFCLNWFDRLIDAGHRALYVGLEQTPAELRVKWACLRTGVAPKLMLAPEPHQTASDPHWMAAAELVQADLKWQGTPDVKARAKFAEAARITRRGLETWTRWAVDHGCEAVFVDHVDRMAHGEGQNSFHELSETIVAAKELALSEGVAMVLASQCGRPNGDPLQKFMPPALHELRGAGTKEEEANAVLAVYRPLKSGVTEAQMKSVRQGLADESTIYEPGTLGVRVLKHRLDGAQLGRQALLTVDRGRLSDRPIRQFGGNFDV